MLLLATTFVCLLLVMGNRRELDGTYVWMIRYTYPYLPTYHWVKRPDILSITIIATVVLMTVWLVVESSRGDTRRVHWQL
jgi:hypothetical protein